mmetsp:Transcript_5444/g.14747  ORF Transcript_5444/g.14747 Transcript_5444/m.14747 type:complete len:226 (-) Transcript_5444:88-765(-)|eukprot:CAMPEP_0198135450 /NCGR_PEP_ID=MMETSP1442-20131203/60594_1 /TAXON_ID= /ORGANISM="Craspedostauros australis, Strain CCMP3328" /LENGTH=225 /DNA_ID=CAMNT_0043796623 /DNA_START=597 /DNA_END=1274 /DNA_ORIENTATION=+
MANFGDLILVLGDYHIPHRASGIHEKFKRMLVPNKMQHAICTGNIQREQYSELCTLAPNVTVVRGDMDIDNEDGSTGVSISYANQLPDTRVVQVGNFRIGVVHGHQVMPNGSMDGLEQMRRRLSVDVLISGHTHKSDFQVRDGYCYINPGSITGAQSSSTMVEGEDEDEIIPSFALLAMQGEKIVCYLYRLKDGEVDVSKTEYMKPSENDASAAAGAPMMQHLMT